jgi:tRNA(Ile)-lysidine synthase
VTKNLKNNRQDVFEDAVLAALDLPEFFGTRRSTPGAVLLAALSGGADSTAMAAALGALRKRAAGFFVHAVHVNHGIRSAEECSADAEAVSALCASLDIPLTVATVPPGRIAAYARRYGTGIEAGARRFRLNALKEEARKLGAAGILLAHTADDRLENIIMAFLRGSGPSGLGSLSACAVQTNGSFPVLRPLLSRTRKDVLEYLEARNISYRSDASNRDERFFRNRVRLRLIPLLDGFFPHWREPLKRLGETQAMTAAFMAVEAAERLSWSGAGTSLSLPAEKFFSQPEIIREEALFQALDRLAFRVQHNTGDSGDDLRKPRRDVLRSFARGILKSADLGRYRLMYSGDGITPHITLQWKEKPLYERGFSVLIKSPGIYKLETLTLTVLTKEPFPAYPAEPKQSFTGEGSPQGTISFFAGFPLAVYTCREKTAAEDKEGRAALIAREGLVWKRESGTGTAYVTVIPREG